MNFFQKMRHFMLLQVELRIIVSLFIGLDDLLALAIGVVPTDGNLVLGLVYVVPARRYGAHIC